MEHPNKINGIQWAGILLGLVGAFFIAFPTIMGVIAIKFITLLLMFIGFYSVMFSMAVRSVPIIVISGSILLLSIYAFLNPEYILLVIGIAFVLNGINGLLLYFKRRTENFLLSGVLMILLGVFAIVNAKAALATVMLILGIVILTFGLILFYQGKLLRPLKRSFFYNFSDRYQTGSEETVKSNKRVIINIDTDEVEEVDYKEI